MKAISNFLQKFASRLERYSSYYKFRELHKRLGSCPDTAVFRLPDVCSCPEKIFLGENTSIYENSKFIISPIGDKGKFIMKMNSYAAQGLTVITGNHSRVIGQDIATSSDKRIYDIDKDVIVEEDVAIGANVTLLAGVKIGRGATIGAGSVCVSNIPAYAIAVGNPAQVIGFNFLPEEIIKHELILYSEEERIPKEKLLHIYDKYYASQCRNIASFLNITLK